MSDRETEFALQEVKHAIEELRTGQAAQTEHARHVDRATTDALGEMRLKIDGLAESVNGFVWEMKEVVRIQTEEKEDLAALKVIVIGNDGGNGLRGSLRRLFWLTTGAAMMATADAWPYVVSLFAQFGG